MQSWYSSVRRLLFWLNLAFSRFSNTVVPQFNKVPRDWGNLFVISRVCYIEHFHLTNFRENDLNVRNIEEKLIINLQNPAFPDLKNYCDNISTELYIATALGTQKQANKIA